MKSITKKFLTALIFSNLAIVSALAQIPGGGPPEGLDGPPPPPPSWEQETAAPNARQFFNRLSKTLKLSAGQKAQIKPIVDSEGHQLDEPRESTDSRQDKFQRVSTIEDQTWAAIRPLLNDAQQKKFDSLTKKMLQRRERVLQEQNDDMRMPSNGPPPGEPHPG